jgi:hypothetical protein
MIDQPVHGNNPEDQPAYDNGMANQPAHGIHCYATDQPTMDQPTNDDVQPYSCYEGQ